MKFLKLLFLLILSSCSIDIQSKSILDINDLNYCFYNDLNIIKTKNLEEQEMGFQYFDFKKNNKKYGILFDTTNLNNGGYSYFHMDNVDKNLLASSYNNNGELLFSTLMESGKKYLYRFPPESKYILEIPSQYFCNSKDCNWENYNLIPKNINKIMCN